jgi:hypothetical protein
MLEKVGKTDRTSVRSYRPIALLSCVPKGLERHVAKRLAWLALRLQLLNPQHCGALPKRSAMDLVASSVHDVELAMARKQEVSLLTIDAQGAFNALLKRRFLARVKKLGFPGTLLRLLDPFLSDRQVRVRFESTTTEYTRQSCGTPQGSPLSPVLYFFYLAELLQQQPGLRFGYADDILLYRASKSLTTNVQQLAADMRAVRQWGEENKVTFTPEKCELMHLSRKKGDFAPACVVDDTDDPAHDHGARAWHAAGGPLARGVV